MAKKHLRQLLKASLAPCVRCPPAAWSRSSLPAEESSCPDWDTPLRGPGCVCCETICSSGSAAKEQNPGKAKADGEGAGPAPRGRLGYSDHLLRSLPP